MTRPAVAAGALLFAASPSLFAFAEDLCPATAGGWTNCQTQLCPGSVAESGTLACETLAMATNIVAQQLGGIGRRSSLHMDATYYMAQAVGFTPRQAYQIAIYDQSADLGQVEFQNEDGDPVVAVDDCQGEAPAGGDACELVAKSVTGFDRNNFSGGGLNYHFMAPQIAYGAAPMPLGFSPDLRDPYGEQFLVHVRRWAFGESALLCVGGITTPGARGDYATGDACYGTDDETRSYLGQIPFVDETSAVSTVSWLSPMVEQMINTQDPAVAAHELPDYVGKDAAPLLALGMYVHAVADRVSHQLCVRASQLEGPRPADAPTIVTLPFGYDVYMAIQNFSDPQYLLQQILTAPIASDPDFVLTFDNAQCDQPSHASRHTFEVGHDQQQLQPDHQTLEPALRAVYDELLAYARQRGFARAQAADADRRDALLVSLVAAIGRVDAQARIDALTSLAQDAALVPLPGHGGLDYAAWSAKAGAMAMNPAPASADSDSGGGGGALPLPLPAILLLAWLRRRTRLTAARTAGSSNGGCRGAGASFSAAASGALACITGLALAALALSGCGDTPAATGTEVACTHDAPTRSPSSWYAGAAPFEGGDDSGRTHLFKTACTTVGTGRLPAVTAEAAKLVGAYNIVTDDTGVYVLSGSFGRIADDYSPLVASLEPHSLTERWRTLLPGITSADWNYPGAIGRHANGKLYAVYGRHVARLDADSGVVEAHATLPVNQAAEDVAYNGFVLLADGRIAAKSIHRKPGCDKPDFQAFFDCDTQPVAPSTLALIDPDTLAVVQQLTMPEHTRFRITVAALDGVEYLYLPGDERIHRYRYTEGRLAPDLQWAPGYLAEGQTAGTAVADFGEWLIVQTNGLPASAPLSIVAISQRDAGRQFRIEPFAGSTRSGSFMPSMPTVDVDNRRVYAFDGYAGELAALDFDPQRGFSVAWKQLQRSFAFGALVGPAHERVFIGTDITARLPNLALRYLGLEQKRRLMRFAKPSPESIVWRDADSGAELGRAANVAAVAGSVATPGSGGALYVPDLHGERLIRLAATAQRR